MSLFNRFVKHGCSAWRDDNYEWRRNDFINGTIEFPQSTYWERLWIIQEVAWAREVEISDRVRSISWRTLQMVLQTTIHHVHTDENEKQQLVTSIPFRLDELRMGTRRTPLMALMADFGALECKDFHDHVMGYVHLQFMAITFRSITDQAFSPSSSRHFDSATDSEHVLLRKPSFFLRSNDLQGVRDRLKIT